MHEPFSLPIEIYYADTDAGGVVYHANYLVYMERARSTCLRLSDMPVARLKDQFNVVFVVTESNLQYVRPAVLDDVIDVSVAIKALRGASVVCQQQITRAGELLVDATIRIATVAADTFSPCKMPPELRQVFQQLQIHSVSSAKD